MILPSSSSKTTPKKKNKRNKSDYDDATILIKKAAKKTLKKHKSKELSLQDLTLALQTTKESKKKTRNQFPNLTTSHLHQCLASSPRKFQIVDGGGKVKLVRLVKTKRLRQSKGSSDDEGQKEGIIHPVTAEDDDDDDVATPTPMEEDGAVVDVSSWRRENKVVVVCDEHNQVHNDPILHPYLSFDDCLATLAPALVQQCREAKFTTPSPIQAQAWPILGSKSKFNNNNNEYHNLVGIAETGSGKTLAFCLPALTRLAKNDRRRQNNNNSSRVHACLPRMLVLTPTRELAMQVQAVLQDYGKTVGVHSMVIYGGVPKHAQVAAMKKGTVDAIVATPGRLKDLMQEQHQGGVALRLDHVEYLVLDEADRMLDLGFEPDVRFLVGHCTWPQRQTCMFSATWPASIQALASTFFSSTNPPIRVYVGFETIMKERASNDEDGANGSGKGSSDQVVVVVDDALSANKRVEQRIEVLEDRQRDARLREILNQVQRQQHPKKANNNNNKEVTLPPRVLVFCLYKMEAERLEFRLNRDGYSCLSIHGNKAQAARTHALEQFTSGAIRLLIATDVAARGLHIPNVEVVINYTFPLTIEDYVHRIGRTGRAGQTGVSYTFFQPAADKARAGELQQVLRQAGQAIPDALLKFGSTIKKKEHKLYGNFGPSSNGDASAKKATKITFNYSDDEGDEA